MNTSRSRQAIAAELRILIDEMEDERGASDAALVDIANTLSRRTIALLIMQARILRHDNFTADLFVEGGWNIVLRLYLGHSEGSALSVGEALAAAGGGETVALRWLHLIEQHGLVERKDNGDDARDAFLALSDVGLAKVEAYLDDFARWIAGRTRDER